MEEKSLLLRGGVESYHCVACVGASLDLEKARTSAWLTLKLEEETYLHSTEVVA